MNLLQRLLIDSSILLLLLQVTTTNALIESFFQSKRPTGNNYTANTNGSYHTNRSTENRTNVLADVNTTFFPKQFTLNTDNDNDIKKDDYMEVLNEETSRQKRDIRNNFLENELQIAVSFYNSEIASQSKSALNSIVSQTNGLTGIQNLLSLDINNLATSGFNDLSSIASTLPVTIQKCYNSYGFKFSDAIIVAKTMARQCLTDKINEAKSIAQDFQNSISNAVANIKDISELIGQCKSFANIYPFFAGLVAKASCLNIAIFSFRSETVLLPLKFATLVGQAFNSITTIHSDMNKCSLEIINTILDQSIQSGNAINNCIKEQNGVSSTTPSLS